VSEAQRGNEQQNMRGSDGDGTMRRSQFRGAGIDGKACTRVHDGHVHGPATREEGVPFRQHRRRERAAPPVYARMSAASTTPSGGSTTRRRGSTAPSEARAGAAERVRVRAAEGGSGER
jgi:hypothetical protein